LSIHDIYLKRLVEKETEVGENNPELLPTITVFELTQEVPTKLILKFKKIEESYLIVRYSKKKRMDWRQNIISRNSFHSLFGVRTSQTETQLTN
jgi:hypothetical protein